MRQLVGAAAPGCLHELYVRVSECMSYRLAHIIRVHVCVCVCPLQAGTAHDMIAWKCRGSASRLNFALEGPAFDAYRELVIPVSGTHTHTHTHTHIQYLTHIVQST